MVQALAEPALSIAPRRPEKTESRLHRQSLDEPCLDELLGTVAHELRSPLASIITGVSVIADDRDVGPSAQRTLASMKLQLWQTLRLVDDLFDLSAGGLRKLSVHKEVVALADVVTQATETAGRLITARQHRLTIFLPPEPIHVEADPLRLAQVLTNLLCNAAKFTDPGGHIRLSAAVEGQQIVIRVEDDGRGIPRTLLPRVFELFHQAPGAGGTGGMGIGLALVKALVELHGGSVAAYSDGPGTGSEFIVRLPIRAAGFERRSSVLEQPFFGR
jgi:signal transduction histidine kinase